MLSQKYQKFIRLQHKHIAISPYVVICLCYQNSSVFFLCLLYKAEQPYYTKGKRYWLLLNDLINIFRRDIMKYTGFCYIKIDTCHDNTSVYFCAVTVNIIFTV